MELRIYSIFLIWFMEDKKRGEIMNLHSKLNKTTFSCLNLLLAALFLCSCGYKEAPNNEYISSEDNSPKTILFEVSVTNNECKDFQKPIDIILSFTNLNDEAIKMADQFLVAKNRHGSGGNIIPLITLHGENVYSLRDNSMMDTPLPEVTSYIEIPADGKFDKLIQYYFPAEILESRQSDQEVVVTPSPGTYSITFTYYQTKKEFSNWHGYVESNQLEICIRN